MVQLLRQKVNLSLKRAILVLAVASVVFGSQVHAAWPEKPITIVVPVPVGGSGDLLARIVAKRLPSQPGQPVVVENTPDAD